MTGPRTDVGEAEFLEELSDTARMKVDAEPLGDDALEVEPTPAHDLVLLTIRTPSTICDTETMAEVLKFPANKHPWTTPGSSPGAEGEAARVTRESNRGRGLTQLRIDKLTRTGATYCVHDAAQPCLSLRVSAGG